ncbi:MAG: ATP synthase F1 subunit epsilon [Firmicutes bacterium]|jgi:F-type H+-transporting ATPase subunit epsilon|nr:ATP synthase F1 subunit epsilon [Bacillota bacterium]MCL5065281.1 ATP synthase F1 subunit epsilon [Bacillota bacterium]
MATFRLRVVTPERTVFDQTVNEIITRSVEGELGILPHHIPIITPLVAHVLTVYLEDQSVLHLAIAGGFLEVNEQGGLILADAAESPEEIDLPRAEAARDRAQTRIDQGGEDYDLHRAQRAMARALSRIAVAQDVKSGNRGNAPLLVE